MKQLVIDDTGSVEDIHAFIYCKKWRSGQVLPMPDWLTDSQTKDSATQLLIKYKSGALVTQCKTMMFVKELKKCRTGRDNGTGNVRWKASQYFCELDPLRARLHTYTGPQAAKAMLHNEYIIKTKTKSVNIFIPCKGVWSILLKTAE